MAIRVVQITDELQLSDSLRSQWNRLPMPSPMQSAEWLIGWWRTFGRDGKKRLCILLVFDDDTLVAVAPWYLNRTWVSAGCLRFLGDGIACSDHATVLIQDPYQTLALSAITDWLRRQAGKHWQSIQLASVDDDDTTVVPFVNRLVESGCELHVRETVGCWTVDLPDSWDAYLSGLSKNHRKRCRRWQRTYFDSNRAKVVLRSVEDFQDGWDRLASLNEERRGYIGDRSAFTDQRFHQFHLSILGNLLAQGKAELRELHLDGKRKAMEYTLQHEGTLFCYQSGMTMEPACDGYGNLSILALFRDAIERGCRRLDFLRGDEDYKQHWGARRGGCSDYHLAANSLIGKAHTTYFRTVDLARGLRDSLVGSSV